MLTTSGYKCGLLTIKVGAFATLANLFSVSFSRLLTRYSAVIETNSNDVRNPTVLKVNSADKRAILLRTSAVRVVNSDTGTSALAYAQLDTGSQVTLISNELSKELGLTITPDQDVSIRTLADQRVSSKGRTNFEQIIVQW